MARNYDPKCGELAEHFLTDGRGALNLTPARREALAAAIQDAIEDWLINNPCVLRPRIAG